MEEFTFIGIGIMILIGMSILGLTVIHIVDTIYKNRFKNIIVKMDLDPGDKICIRAKFGYSYPEQLEGLKYKIADWAGISVKDIILVDANSIQQMIIFKEGVNAYYAKSERNESD